MKYVYFLFSICNYWQRKEIGGKKHIILGLCMSHPSICENRKFIIKKANLDQVITACNEALNEMGFNVKKRESTSDGKTSIFAAEGAIIPLTMKILAYPFQAQDYMQSAQRSGIHVLIVPSQEAILLHVCGIALTNLTGRPEKYQGEGIEEVTDTMKNLQFEERFIKKIGSAFPSIEEVHNG
jgi:hypothetical protein